MFNQAAAAAANLPLGSTFFIENFTYANSVVMARLFEHLSNVTFSGVTVCVCVCVYVCVVCVCVKREGLGPGFW